VGKKRERESTVFFTLLVGLSTVLQDPMSMRSYRREHCKDAGEGEEKVVCVSCEFGRFSEGGSYQIELYVRGQPLGYAKKDDTIELIHLHLVDMMHCFFLLDMLSARHV